VVAALLHRRATTASGTSSSSSAPTSTGSVAITVEPASAWPKSALLQNLRLDKAIERGIINPQTPKCRRPISR
jgi:hypothetical protein